MTFGKMSEVAALEERNRRDEKKEALAKGDRPVCPNCGQWADGGDCFNECVKRGFAPKHEDRSD